MTCNGIGFNESNLHCITFTSGFHGMPNQFKYWVSKHPNVAILAITQYCSRSDFGTTSFFTSIWYKEDEQ